jgi:ketosteroid isomerase-like protein
MSQENVEMVRVANAAFNRGDLDSVFEFYAVDAEFRDLLNGPDQPSVVKGGAAAREVVALWLAAFDDLRVELHECVEAGDAVICDVRWIGEGKGSGISIDARQFDTYEFRDGKVVRATLGYRSKAEALEAVGLSEQDAHADS